MSGASISNLSDSDLSLVNYFKCLMKHFWIHFAFSGAIQIVDGQKVGEFFPYKLLPILWPNQQRLSDQSSLGWWNERENLNMSEFLFEAYQSCEIIRHIQSAITSLYIPRCIPVWHVTNKSCCAERYSNNAFVRLVLQNDNIIIEPEIENRENELNAPTIGRCSLSPKICQIKIWMKLLHKLVWWMKQQHEISISTRFGFNP